MMTDAQVEERCEKLRAGQLVADDDLAGEIERDVDEMREHLTEPRPQQPPDKLVEPLWMMGWLIYEASIGLLWSVAPAFDAIVDERREQSDNAGRLISRFADAARALPWPEFAPRALGAIRAQALVASKRDTASGYSQAWIMHEEARNRHASFEESHGDDPSRKRYQLGLKEVLLQLALAETGTACRTAERVIGRWAEELEQDDPEWTAEDEAYWVQLMFQELAQGVAIGGRALDVAAEIEKEYGFARRVDRNRLALPTAFQNPGIMTARAALLMVALCAEMENLRRHPVFGHDTWDEMRTALLERFEQAYRAIEKPVYDGDGNLLPLNATHQRSLVQIRLNAALLVPGYDLPSGLDFHPCLRLNPLDDDAVEALCVWLDEKGENGRQRGDANVIGSATNPSFIRSVEGCRAKYRAGGGYREWRAKWPNLDRYVNESGRSDRVKQALNLVTASATPDDTV